MRRIIPLACFVFLVFLSGGVSAATNISSCTTISTPGVYLLNQSISGSNTCIKIESSDVVFDGQGYSSSGGTPTGIYVYNSSTTLINVTVRNVKVEGWSSGIYYENVKSGSITNNTASSNTDGILLLYSDNIILTNNTANSNSWDGIYIDSSSDNTLTNNTVNSNNNHGIFLESSGSNSFIDNTANSNEDAGIILYSSNNNTLTNNNASNNNHGIYLYSSNNNDITNNTAKENNYYDMIYSATSDAHCNNIIENNTGSGDRPIKYFNSPVSLQDETLSALILCNADNSNINSVTIEGSATKKNNMLQVIRTDYSNFTNINSSSNWYGIYLDSSSNYNTLTNNTVNANTYQGISLLSSNSNTIYNNLFNNTDNFYFSRTVYTNDWNTTKQAGTNIVGGPYLGGNFWAKPDGTGFSETCTDADSDGICDSSYALASWNVDYLPLSLNFTVDTYPPARQRRQHRHFNGNMGGNVNGNANTNINGNYLGNVDTGGGQGGENPLSRLWQWLRGSGRGR